MRPYDLMIVGPATRDRNTDYTGREELIVGGAVTYCTPAAMAAGARVSAASSIVKKIETQGDAYVRKYLDFLKCGGSRSPLDSLLVADIDLTKPEVIEDAIADFAATVEQFRALYEKLHP